jgi:hypothetical protein
MNVSQVTRQPIWSDALTAGLAARVPVARRAMAMRAIKTIHTIAFGLISGAILMVAWEGLRGRPSRRAGLAAAVAIAESVVYASNNQVCPLTPLAEALGAERGTVTDLYLPDWASRRVPLVGGSILVLGLALHLSAWRARRSRRAQLGTTTTGQVARRATSDETLPRMSRRTFRRGREPRKMMSAASACEASRMASAGSPSQIR